MSDIKVGLLGFLLRLSEVKQPNNKQKIPGTTRVVGAQLNLSKAFQKTSLESTYLCISEPRETVKIVHAVSLLISELPEVDVIRSSRYFW